MKLNNSSNIKAGVVITYITQFASIAISLIYIPIMLRMLGQEEYGLYALVQSFVAYLQMSEMGIGITATRYNSKSIAIGDTLGQMSINGLFRILYLGIALFSLTAGIVVYFQLPSWYSHYSPQNIDLISNLFIIALANLIISLSFKIYNAIIMAYEKFIFLKLLSLTTTVLGPLGMLLVLNLGYRSIGMLYVATLSYLFSGLLQYYYCRSKLKVKFSYNNIPKGLLIKILSFTAFVSLNSIAHQLFTNSDKIVISLLLTETAIAIYAIVLQFQVYYFNFSNVISGFFLPKFTKSIASTGEVTDILMVDIIKTSRMQLFIAAFILGGFVTIGRQFIIRWVGVEYEPAYLLSVIVLFAEFLGSPQSMFNSLMQAMNCHKGRAMISLTFAVLKIGVIILMVYKIGILGCAIGYLIIYILRIIAYNFYYKRVGIDIVYFWRKLFTPFLKITILCILLYVLAHFTLQYVKVEGYSSILISASAYAILFIVGSWLAILNKDEKKILNSIGKRLNIC